MTTQPEGDHQHDPAESSGDRKPSSPSLGMPLTKRDFPCEADARRANAATDLPDNPGLPVFPPASLDWRSAVPWIVDAFVREMAATRLVTRGHGGAELNELSKVGNTVSRAVRKELLLRVLVAEKWNMTRAGETLRMGSASNVRRAIRELDLEEQLTAAKDGGLIRRGGHKKKTSPSLAR